MPAFLVTKKESDQLDVPVFSSESEDDIVIVFTEEEKAHQYVIDSKWEEEQVVAQLDTIAFLEWLVHCHREGIDILAVDPIRKEQDSGEPINTTSIKEHLDNAGDQILMSANPATGDGDL